MACAGYEHLNSKVDILPHNFGQGLLSTAPPLSALLTPTLRPTMATYPATTAAHIDNGIPQAIPVATPVDPMKATPVDPMKAGAPPSGGDKNAALKEGLVQVNSLPPYFELLPLLALAYVVEETLGKWKDVGLKDQLV